MSRLLLLLAAQLADVVLEDVLLVAHLVDAAVALVFRVLRREVAERRPANRRPISCRQDQSAAQKTNQLQTKDQPAAGKIAFLDATNERNSVVFVRFERQDGQPLCSALTCRVAWPPRAAA